MKHGFSFIYHQLPSAQTQFTCEWGGAAVKAPGGFRAAPPPRDASLGSVLVRATNWSPSEDKRPERQKQYQARFAGLMDEKLVLIGFTRASRS